MICNGYGVRSWSPVLRMALKIPTFHSSGSLKDIWTKTKGDVCVCLGGGGVTLLTFRQLPQVEVQKFAESLDRSI